MPLDESVDLSLLLNTSSRKVMKSTKKTKVCQMTFFTTVQNVYQYLTSREGSFNQELRRGVPTR